MFLSSFYKWRIRSERLNGLPGAEAIYPHIIATSAYTVASIAVIHFSKFLIIFKYNSFLTHSSFVCHPLGYEELET
jgi:hypothetical protein